MIGVNRWQRKANAIASHLGGWRLDFINSQFRHCYLLGPNRAKLSLYFDEWKKRVNVSGCLSSRGDTPSAGMSYRRHSSALASDIQRRVIEEYMPLLALDQIRAKEKQADRQAFEALFALILRESGCERYGQFNDYSLQQQFSNWDNGKARVRGSMCKDVIDLNLTDLTPDQAFKVFNALELGETNEQ